MATLEKIVKVTQSQYDTLVNGGTVHGETGLNDNGLYLVEDNSGGKYLGDVVVYGSTLDEGEPTFDPSQMQNKMVMFSFSAADKNSNESYGTHVFCMNSIVNFVTTLYVTSLGLHGDLAMLGISPAGANALNGYYLNGLVSFPRATSEGSYTPTAANTEEGQDFWNTYGLRISVFIQDVNGIVY